MRIVKELNEDKEIQVLREQVYKITGENLSFNYDSYVNIEEYKEHLRKCVKERKIVVRPKDEEIYHRYDSIISTKINAKKYKIP